MNGLADGPFKTAPLTAPPTFRPVYIIQQGN